MTSQAPLLQVRGLCTEISTRHGAFRVVDDVNIEIGAGEAVALVGESGCGKSMTALSLLRLAPEPPVRVAGGEVLFQGRNLVGLSASEMRSIRGRDIGMIFQDPMTFLNPVLTVEEQIAAPLRHHLKLSAAQRRARVLELLDLVRIPDPARIARSYPHELSGGMRQRVLIAGALACSPKLLIADEPTTALDVTIQSQILEVLQQSLKALGTALLLITHNMGVVAGTCNRVYVMYAGRVIESAGVDNIFAAPRHPYTRGLLRSALRHDQPRAEFRIMKGSVPNLLDPPAGCRFRPRCDQAMPKCEKNPPWTAFGEREGAACWLHAP
jgi:oligopeptide/dipeptide ABC transporter ATP-binding protein